MNITLKFLTICLVITLTHCTSYSDEWFAKYTKGCVFEEKGEWENALKTYLEAYELDPHRAEPLRKIATHYRRQGHNHLAFFFAKKGTEIQQSTFIDDIAPYQFDQEISISAYYTPFKEEGFEAANRLILQRGVPGKIKQEAYQNILYYARPLEKARFVDIDIDLPPLNPGSPYHYNQMNPSILKNKSGYTLICRTVNFLHHLGGYDMIDGSSDVHTNTRNFKVQLSKNFEVLSQKEIIENFPRYSAMWNRVEGLEDCRLIDENSFVCTTWGATIHEIPQMVLCKMQKSKEHSIPVTSFTPLKGPDPSRCEKNWLPFFKKGALHFIYSYDPFIIYKTDPLSGECAVIDKYIPEWDLSNFRGSAPPIPFDKGYLLLVHEVVCKEQRFYLHRFLYLDKDFKIKKASLPFIFRQKGIEYCLGMTVCHGGTHLVMPIGIDDKEAYLCIVDLETVRSLLKDLHLDESQ